NPSFEDAGTLPGDAAHWTLTAVTSLEEIAGFGALPEQAWEDFERWFELLAELDSVLTSRAFFAPGTDGFESFTTGWGAGAYLFELPPAQVVPGQFSADNVEDCETGWSNASFYWSWDGVPAATGTFDGESREDFEDSWRSNESFAWSWSGVASSTAMFDSGAQGVEDFENSWTHAGTL
ncbi:MAG: hypothetical protein JW751_32315, partial [Polyangiaceae bacterium]|nr:hypothetical protein [Polyangiaceae bacterium]